MSPHKGKTLRVSLFVLFSLILSAVLAACGVFFYIAFSAIHHHTPMELLGYAPVTAVTDVGAFDDGDLLLVSGAGGSSFPFSAKGESYLAEKAGYLYSVASLQEPGTEADGRLLLTVEDAAPVLRFLLTPERLLLLLIAILLAAIILETVLGLLLLGRKKSRRRKKDDSEDELSELDKYAELDYNPFPQKLYSSKVEMVEIEDYKAPAVKNNVAVKIGTNPVKVFPLTEETEFSDELDGYRITLSVKKL